MKLWVIANVDLSSRKGGAAHVMQFVRHVCNRGHNVRLFIPRPKGEIPSLPSDVSLLPRPGSSFWVSHVLFEIIASLLMLRLFFKERPDRIYIRHNLFCLLPVLVARILGRRAFIEQNGVVSAELEMAGRPQWERSLQDRIERITYRNCAEVIAVTEGIRRHLIEDLGVEPNKVHVISNGADPDVMRPQPAGPARESLGLDAGCAVVGYVGNFEPYQDLDSFIDALALIKAAGLEFKALIVGGGTRFGEIQDRARERGVEQSCLFLGPKPHLEIADHIAAMDVCVVPKRPLSSGYSPIKLFEYLACGRPVVASDLPGFEIIKEHGLGVLAAPEDAQELADAVAGLIKDPELRREMGKRARAYAEGPGSWAETVKNVLKVLGG